MGRAKGNMHAVAAPARRGQPALDAEPELTMAELYDLDPDNLTDEVEQRPTPNMDNGHIIVPRSQKEVDETIARWKSFGPQPIAHDLECAASPTVPNGSGLHPHLGTIRLAQFGVADGGHGRPEALVVNVWKLQAEEILPLLADEEWPTIIHFAQMETRWLGYRYGLRVENLIDTRLVAKLLYDRDKESGIWRPRIIEDKVRAVANKGPSFSLGVTSKRDLGIALDKTQQNSHWDARRLSKDQETYAGYDVLSLLDLWDRMRGGVTYEMEAKMSEAATKLANRWSGRPDEDYLVSDEYKPYEVKGCEWERAVRVIRACRNAAELEQARKALPYMRIHFSNRDKVDAEFNLQRRRIREGRVKKPIKVQVAGWKQPF